MNTKLIQSKSNSSKLCRPRYTGKFIYYIAYNCDQMCCLPFRLPENSIQLEQYSRKFNLQTFLISDQTALDDEERPTIRITFNWWMNILDRKSPKCSPKFWLGNAISDLIDLITLTDNMSYKCMYNAM